MKSQPGLPSAVALKYEPGGGDAPRVVATGRGELAVKILETARRTGIQVVEDADLLEVLARVPIGQEIPAELYQAVAGILAFVYRVNGRYNEKAERAGEPSGTLDAD